MESAAHTHIAGAAVVAIAGGSGSGKTTLARAVCAALQPARAALLSEDDYYLCARTIVGFDPSTHDFDALAAKDMALLAQHLGALRRGETIEKPRYDFTIHQRMPDSEPLSPPDVVVLEGIHALSDLNVCAQADYKVFLDAPGDVRLARRLLRDVQERGRQPGGVIAQYFSTVRPNHEALAPIQRARADLVLTIAPETDIAALASQVAAKIVSKFEHAGRIGPAADQIP
jgi:uridine kinase